MNASKFEKMNTSMTGDKTFSLGSHEVEDVGNAAASSSPPITSEEVVRQIEVAIDPLTRQLEKLCDLMKQLRRDTWRRSEETSAWLKVPIDSNPHAALQHLVVPPTVPCEKLEFVTNVSELINFYGPTEIRSWT